MAIKYSFLCLFWTVVLEGFLLPCTTMAQTHIGESQVSGNWTKAGSPYLIKGNITIPAGKMLTVAPGTTIIFSGRYNIQVKGSIRALGEEDEPINISCADSLRIKSSAGWRGIKIQGNLSQKDSSMFSWCRISFGNATDDKVEKCRGGAIFADSCHYLKISHCTFLHNIAVAGGAVYVRNSTIIVEGCHFEKNKSLTDGGALCIVRCKMKMYNNTLLNNDAHTLGGALMLQNMKGLFANNVIAENTSGFGGGIALIHDTSSFINNTIASNKSLSNGGGVHMEKSTTRFINSILWDNQSKAQGTQGYLFDKASPRFWFCNLQDGTTGLKSFSGSSSVDDDYNNIDQDPNFLQADTSFYALAEGSPCIDYGIPDTSSLHLPKSDLSYRERINGKKIDMGAYEFGASLMDEDELNEEGKNGEGDQPKLKLLAYPNPSNGSFQVLVSNPEHKSLVLHIASSAGNAMIESPVKETEEVFILPVEINGKPGIYMMNVMDEKGKKLKQKKMVVN
jgi:hypothetical protein